LLYIFVIIYNTLLYIFLGEEEKPDCNEFMQKCQDLCLEESNGVLEEQCWGEPLYAYCKASDGKVFHIPGFVCEHPTCPPDA